MFNLIKKLISKNANFYKLIRRNYYKFLRKIIPDKIFIKYEYKKKTGKKLNLENPVTYNEKLQWLKLNWRDPLLVKCADKFLVRKFIKKRKCGNILNELYGVYEEIDEINFTNLPNQFVLKATHGSGYNYICKDKGKLNKKVLKEKFKHWMKQSHYWFCGEWHYDFIKPRIICEKYLDDGTGDPPKDYKIFCFHGEPKFIEVDIDRFGDRKRNIYDINWNKLDLEIKYPSTENKDKRPYKLNYMLKIAKKLSDEFCHVRVDLFEVKNKIYFGELTFFHGSGFEEFRPFKYDKIFGDYLNLKKCSKTKK